MRNPQKNTSDGFRSMGAGHNIATPLDKKRHLIKQSMTEQSYGLAEYQPTTRKQQTRTQLKPKPVRFRRPSGKQVLPLLEFSVNKKRLKAKNSPNKKIESRPVTPRGKMPCNSRRIKSAYMGERRKRKQQRFHRLLF